MENKQPKKEVDNQALIDQMKKMQERINSLERDKEVLMSVADKKRMARYMQKHKKHEPNRMSLRALDGKVVIGWRSTKDEVGQNPQTGAWYERQNAEYVFEDGSSKEMSQKEFELNHNKVECERIGIETDEETGKVAFKLRRLDSGKVYTVPSYAVN